MAEDFPTEQKSIQPYIVEYYPTIMSKGTINLKSLDIHRTFFEKLTILHREANRTNKTPPKRYSRHYYDVYCMISNGIGESALGMLQILGKVIDFTTKFYPCSWAEYEKIFERGCVLVPKDEAIKTFTEDYDIMQGMLFGSPPSFSIIIKCLEKYEQEINKKILEYQG